MLRAKEIVEEDELGNDSLESRVIRLTGTARVRERQAGGRDLLDIPPSELATVLGRLFPSTAGTGQDHDAMLRGLMDYYGFTRLTKARKDYLSVVLQCRFAGSDVLRVTEPSENTDDIK
jgi:hypothetical protein